MRVARAESASVVEVRMPYRADGHDVGHRARIRVVLREGDAETGCATIPVRTSSGRAKHLAGELHHVRRGRCPGDRLDGDPSARLGTEFLQAEVVILQSLAAGGGQHRRRSFVWFPVIAAGSAPDCG